MSVRVVSLDADSHHCDPACTNTQCPCRIRAVNMDTVLSALQADDPSGGFPCLSLAVVGLEPNGAS